jgi:hypothetical protein
MDTGLPYLAAVQVAQRLRGAVSSKIYGYEDVLCPLIAQACIEVSSRQGRRSSSSGGVC